ncbi:MAG: hypothetical protein R3B93_06045 [Bacteroidia bacterium]
MIENNKLPIPNGISIGDFLNELAYHESAHFVLNQLIIKLDLGFPETDWIFIAVDETGQFVARGMVHTVNWPFHIIRRFFSENLKRVSANILKTAAGYASYPIFCNPNDQFISFNVTYNKDQTPEIVFPQYLNLREAFELTRNRPSDIVRIDITFLHEYYQVRGDEKKFRIIEATFDLVDEILRKEKVSEAIELVKTKLLENGSDILAGSYYNSIKRLERERNEVERGAWQYFELSGEELENLKGELNTILETINIRDSVEQLHKKIESIKAENT